MINAKVKLFKESYISDLQPKMNKFLKEIDVRQIIKSDYSINQDYVTAIIYYVPFEDIRDAKLDNILEIK